MKNKILLSKQKIEELEKELDSLEKYLLEEAVESNDYGHRHEGIITDVATKQKSKRVKELKTILKNASVIPTKNNKIFLSKEKIHTLKEEARILKRDIQKYHEAEHANIQASQKEAVISDIAIRAKEKRLRDIKKILKHAKETPKNATSNNVSIGSKIVLRDTEGNEHVFRLVHSIEANPLKGLLSDESPLGKLLVGRKVGDIINLNGSKFKIIKIL